MPRSRRGLPTALALLLSLTGCERVFFPFPPRSPRVEQLPTHLSQAGLYADASLSVLSTDLRPYAPAYEFWSDGATKRRFIRLPEAERIDTSNMDDWDFPVGTELWKEFWHEGVRVETRLLRRASRGEDGWVAVSYAWNLEQTEALAVPKASRTRSVRLTISPKRGRARPVTQGGVVTCSASRRFS